jgi:hypothetical protein
MGFFFLVATIRVCLYRRDTVGKEKTKRNDRAVLLPAARTRCHPVVEHRKRDGRCPGVGAQQPQLNRLLGSFHFDWAVFFRRLRYLSIIHNSDLRLKGRLEKYQIGWFHLLQRPVSMLLFPVTNRPFHYKHWKRDFTIGLFRSKTKRNILATDRHVTVDPNMNQTSQRFRRTIAPIHSAGWVFRCQHDEFSGLCRSF